MPNVGKSTLFNALTDNNILAANYPFATIEPNTGIVPIPDERLNKLSEMYNGAPIKPAAIEFLDIAGLVAGASQGEGLGNQFLAHIRSCNAIVQVVRAFEDPNVVRSDSSKDPLSDIEIINTELVLADLQTVEKRLPALQKEAKANPKIKPQVELVEDIKRLLDNGKPLFAKVGRWKIEDRNWLRKELQLLTMKPIIYLFNVDEETLQNESKKQELTRLIRHPSRNVGLDGVQGAGEQRTEPYTKYGDEAAEPATQQSAKTANSVAGSASQQVGGADISCVFMCAKLEDELRGLDKNDRIEMLESYGQSESGLVQLIHAAYDTLGLQSYLTAGEKEVRAWTIDKGATAPQAAGVIHGDFEKGFIAAEVVNYQDLIETGSLPAARAAGKVRTEGKTYVMQPNDVVEFRFNV